MFNTMTSQFYEWVRSSMKKHAVTIGCFTCHMPTQQILTCDPNSQWSLHAFFMEDSAIHKTVIVLFVCLFALRPKSTAMVIAGRSVHLTTLFPGQAWTSG